MDFDPTFVSLGVSVVAMILGTAGTVFTYFAKRELGRHDKIADDVESLKIRSESFVTYQHLEKVIDRMDAIRAHMHAENMAAVAKLEGKLDANATRDAATLHGLRNDFNVAMARLSVINEIMMKFAELNGLGDLLKGNRG